MRMVFHQPILKLIFSGKLYLHIGLEICGSQGEISQNITRGHGDVAKEEKIFFQSICVPSNIMLAFSPQKTCMFKKIKNSFLLVKVLQLINFAYKSTGRWTYNALAKHLYLLKIC